MRSRCGARRACAAGLLPGVIGMGLLAGTRAAVGTGAEHGQPPTQHTSDVTVNEGTSFAVSRSPDGRTLVIDLLGSLWTIPAEGGAAKRLSDLFLEARQPAFSPKGDRIAFQGYRDDGWDVWTIAPDGSGARPLTWGPYDDQEPHWSPDGRYVAFSSDRSGNYDIWTVDTRTGALGQLTKSPTHEFSPAWSPDGREVAYVSAREKAGVWAVNVESGNERLLVATDVGGGRFQRGAIAPMWTPDGTQVVYAVVADGAARLELSGTPLVTGEDVFPYRVQWLSPAEFLYTSDGKIKKRALAAAGAQAVEFRATLSIERPSYARKRLDFDSQAPRKALGIVRPTVSLDGKRVVFAAVGDIWSMDIGSTPARITADRFLDTDPAFSPDGSHVVFSSDRFENGNLDLWLRDLKTGRDRRLTDLPTPDVGASYSADGKRIAFLSVLSHQGGADVYVFDSETGALKKVHHVVQYVPSRPTWSADGRTLIIAALERYSERFREGRYKLMAISVETGDAREHHVLPHASIVSGVGEGPVWSPDGTKLALVNQGLVRILDVGAEGAPLGPMRQVTSEASHEPSWTGDSRHILYLATDRLKMVSVDDGRVREVPLEVEFRASMPSGRLVVHAGRLWNGRDAASRPDVDIVIAGNRIRAIEPHQAAHHSGTVVDASQQTVMPGLIDMHAHVYREYGESLGRLLLSYGVTTVRDPAGFQYRSLEIREAHDAGVRTGPRMYLSAPAIDGTRMAFAEMYPIDSVARLELEVERSRRLGYDFFKTYVRLPDALQQRVVELAHRAGMHVTSHEIFPAAAVGVDGTEHLGGKTSALGTAYGDVMTLLLRSGMTLCPTLAMGTLAWLGSEDPTMLTDERLRVLLPDWAMEGVRSRVRGFAETGPSRVKQGLARQGQVLVEMARSGGSLVAGTDAPNIPHGLALHAEIETYVRAGLTPLEALQTATANAAKALGEPDLGTIDVGKLADLVVVEGDPLADIRNARRVKIVIKNGHVHELNALLRPSGGGPTSASR